MVLVRTPSACRASAGRTISTIDFDNGISDDIFEKIVACIRVAVPYTGMIISTRESKACRERVLRLGVSQISGGSRTSVGGYAEEEPEEENSAQFDVSDNRTLDQVVRWLMELGYIPSFCTACYREGRTGDRFMSLMQERADSELLSSECADDAQGVSGGLCGAGDERDWREADSGGDRFDSERKSAGDREKKSG